MTGKGRCSDNIFIERFWRSLKQEAFYLNDYELVAALRVGIASYVDYELLQSKEDMHLIVSVISDEEKEEIEPKLLV